MSTEVSEWSDGEYPTEAALARIKAWPAPDDSDWSPLLAFVRSIWWSTDFGWPDAEGKGDNKEHHISTGGWSGNEDLIGALMGNHLFWLFCWQQSRRGGHFIFRARLYRK